MEELSASAVPDIARRIMAFHLASREPEQDDVAALAQLLKIADHSPQEAAAFQEVMHVVALGQPGRAKWSNRLHHDKGCAYCKAPCRYGFFTLVSEPDFITLKAMLDVENKKLVQERDAVHVLWTYTKKHVWRILGNGAGIITAEDLGNLSYCLLLLGTAKSRFALPETQLEMYQGMTYNYVQNFKEIPITLS